MFNKANKNKTVVFKFATRYSNCIYMALTLTFAIIVTEGVFHCSAIIMTFQIFPFTHYIFIMTKNDNSKSHFS